MKDYFIHFVSPVPYSLNINGEYVDLVDNISKFSIDIIVSGSQTLYFSYLPYDEKNIFLPYTQALQIKNDCIASESENIEIVPYKNNHFDIILKPIKYLEKADSEIIYEESFGKINLLISNDETSHIYLYDNGKIVLNKTIDILKNVEVEKINNNLVIKGYFENQNYFLLVINLDNYDIVIEETCDSIEKANNKLKLIKSVKDLACHGKVSTLDLDTNKVEEYNVYLNPEPTITNNRYLIPLAFLESLKIKNYTLAKSYLSPTMQNAEIDQFNEFFGEIKNIYFDRHNYQNKNVFYTVFSKKYVSYEFILKNNKIEEILR